MRQVVSERIFCAAFSWVCGRRQDACANADVWDFRHRWRNANLAAALRRLLGAGAYKFSPVQRVRVLAEGRMGTGIRDVWCAQDAFVLKCLQLVLDDFFVAQEAIPSACTHVRGHGGLRASLQKAAAALEHESHVMRGDVAGYYASVDHFVLRNLLEAAVGEESIIRLVWASLRGCRNVSGHFTPVSQGMSHSSPLSPLLAAVYLQPLDTAMGAHDVMYTRYMDDWIIIAPTRWKLRCAIRDVHNTLDTLGLRAHPSKTWIGRGAHGFDFCGFHIRPHEVVISRDAVARHVTRIGRLYEQGASPARVGLYIRNWQTWKDSLCCFS